MSEHALKLFPRTPHFVPTEAGCMSALDLLKQLIPFPRGTNHRVECFTRVEFLHPGENLQAVVCPACDSKLEVVGYPEPAQYQDWWYGIEQELQGCSFDLAKLTMPCCNVDARFTELHFIEPGGFARMVLSVDNPDPELEVWNDRWLKPSVVKQFEQLLGCEVAQMWEMR